MGTATKAISAAVAAALASLTVPHRVWAEPDDDGGKPDRAAMRARMLKRIDTDGDGEVSREELAKAQSARRSASSRSPPSPASQS